MARHPLLILSIGLLLLGGIAAQASEPPPGKGRGAASLARQLGTPATGEAVADALAALEPGQMEDALRLAKALGRSGGSHAAFGLVSLVAHADEDVRLAALRSAAHVNLRMEALAQAAREALRSRLPAEREAALKTLGRIGDGRDVERFLAFVEAEQEPTGVREAALEALADLGGVRIPDVPTRWRAWWRDQDRRDRADIELALNGVADLEATHRALFGSVLARLGWLDIVTVREMVRHWLRQPEPHLRAVACRLVGALRLADLASEVDAARRFDLRRGYRVDADAALQAIGWVPPAPDR